MKFTITLTRHDFNVHFLRSYVQNKRKDETFTVELKDDFIHLQDRLALVSLNLNEYPVRSSRHYFFIRIETGGVFFFPKTKIDAELYRQLEARVKNDKQ